MRYLILVLVVLGGAVIPVQVAANKRLEQAVRSPVLAAAIALLVGGIVLALLSTTGWLGRGRISGAATSPWWVWLAASFSIFTVVPIIALPRVGCGSHRGDGIRSTHRRGGAGPIWLAWRAAGPAELVAHLRRRFTIGRHAHDAAEMSQLENLVHCADGWIERKRPH